MTLFLSSDVFDEVDYRASWCCI